MALGFLDANGNYFVAISDIPTPAGATPVPLRPGPQWVWADGYWQEGPAPAPVVPEAVSRFQARAALLQAGLLEQAEIAVAEAGPLAVLAWQDAQEFRRNSPTINALAPALGLTSEQIDALFIAAAQIEA